MPLRPVDDPQWLELVRTDPAATAFHHPAWTRAIATAYGFDSFLVTVEGNGGIDAALPVVEASRMLRGRRWVSLPFTDHCPPLGDPASFDLLAQELDSARRAASIDSVEVRHALPLVDGTPTGFVEHVVDLEPDIERVEARYASSVRRGIRRASSFGMTWRMGDGEDDLVETFYSLLVGTRQRLGLPVQPRSFFKHLWRALGPDLCRTVIVELDGRPIAGLVLLTWKTHAVFKYGASDRSGWPMRPNNLLFAETIRWACENGYTQFNMGRTDLDAPTLRRFKRGWGPREESLTYTLIGHPRRVTEANSRPMIRSILRHSPRWLVRLTGEVVYRHAA